MKCGTLQTFANDTYKHTIGNVMLPDSRKLDQELVKQGWCRWYRKYAPGDMVLKRLERKHERGGKACGAIRSQCRCGGSESAETKAMIGIAVPQHA
jgi:hypothetical protein